MTEELKDKIVEYEKEKHYVHVDNAKKFGYKPIEPYKIKEYSDGSYGILVTFLDTEKNNGEYFLRVTTDKACFLEVEKPNTISKYEMVKDITDKIDAFINNLNTNNLDVYDFATIFGDVIVSNVIKPLALALYPDDKIKQYYFADVFMKNFLNETADLFIGNRVVEEDKVNTLPYMVKVFVDENFEELKKAGEELEKSIKQNKE